jgi:hypothetical protein
METGYDNIFHEDYMVNLLYKALNYKIVERIFSIHPLLTSFDNWKHHTIQIDQNMQMFKDLTSHNYQSGLTIPNRNPQPQYNNHASSKLAPQAMTYGGQGQSMLVDRKYFKCRRKGHFAKECRSGQLN